MNGDAPAGPDTMVRLMSITKAFAVPLQAIEQATYAGITAPA